jgi:hypothetical protein
MSLADDVTFALPGFRATAESLMLDTFAAYSPGGTTTDADGYEIPGFTDEGSTPGKVSGRSRDSDTNTRTVTVGGVERVVVDGGLHIPLSAPVPAIGWEYQMVTAGPSTDPALVGRRWRVVDVPAKSYATARRLDVVEVTA